MDYVPERNKEKARNIESHKLNVLVAPVGYGKSALVRSLELPNLVTVNLTDSSATYEDNWGLLTKVAESYPPLAEMLSEIPIPRDTAGIRSALTQVCLQSEKITEQCYIFIDNAHLSIDFGRISKILDAIEVLPDNIHLILVSRNALLTLADRVKLGSGLFEMGVEDFKLTEEEVVDYAVSMGIELTEQEAQFLHNRTEGWPGCLYGILSQYRLSGVWPDINSFVVGVVSQSVPAGSIDDRMAVLSIVDTFDIEFVHFIWNALAQAKIDNEPRSLEASNDVERKISMIEASDILRTYESRIGFIYRVVDGMESSWRFHWALRYCAADQFDCLPAGVRHEIRNALNAWNAAGGKKNGLGERRQVAARTKETARKELTVENDAVELPEDAYISSDSGEKRSEAVLGRDVFPELTARERKLVTFAMHRMSNAEMAAKLYLSEGTIKVYFSNIYSKLEIQGGERGKRGALEDLIAERVS